MTSVRCCFVSIFLALSTAVLAQPGTVVQKDRIVARPDLRTTTTLRGHVPAWAVDANDRGAIPADTSLRLTFVLSRSPELQASFLQLLADQQNPNSSSYHQWLTPQEVGERYGPTQHDLDALINWLSSQGFAVVETAPSRVFVSVVAPASTVASALATSFHSFDDNGESRLSAVTDPAIPAAFASIVSSISGLADPAIRPMYHSQVVVGFAKPDAAGVEPQYTSSSGSHYITPGDFATIFNLKPVYSAGYTGSGQKVAIIGRSRVVSSDITAFEARTGLATNVPNTIIPTTGIDPGVSGNGDEAEATLDVERVIGTAPKVQADLVVSGSAGGTSGLYLAAQYEVQTLLDPVMTISFGSCEAFNGPSGVSFWDTLFSQAASEGISVFVSSGDSGAATCDTQFGTPQAYQFRSINYICASSYATCVGGTEFADSSNPAQYWATTNGTDFSSALGYIPEGAWNEPNSFSPYVVASGGGGASIYVPKPAWQAGIGVPSDDARDVPDVSFPSAIHDGYFICYALGGGDCGANRFAIFAGTSTAAPAMAGVTALLNQKMGGSQGNLNPLLYRLAANAPSVFHDATPASSGVLNCNVNVASMCNNSTPSANSLTGGLAGYALTTGYDQATGLGSLDVANFLNAASDAKSGRAATALTVKGSATVISTTQTVVFTATLTSQTAGAPGGTVQFYADGNTLGAAVPLVSGKAVTAALPFPAAGSYYITAIYSGDMAYASTTAPGVALAVTGLGSSTKVTASSTAIPIWTNATFTATVTPVSGSIVPTGTVRFYIPGSTNDAFVAIVPLSGSSATTPAINFSKLGSYTLVAEYVGDSVYSPSNSAATFISVQKLVSVNQLSSTSGSIGAGGSKGYTATILGTVSSIAPAPTGTIQLYANGVAIGTPTTVSALGQNAQGVSVGAFATAGTYTITSVYSGDANWLPSTSSVVSLTVLNTPASYQLAAMAPTLSVSAGGTTLDTVSITGLLGFAGPVNINCSISYNGTGTATSLPTCSSLSNNPVTVNVDSSAPSYSFSIVTTAPRAVRGPTLSAAGGPRNYRWEIPGGAAFCTFLFCLIPVGRRPRRMLAMLVVLAAGFGALSGCGGGSSPGTTPGSYTVTISASTTVSGIPVPAPVTIALTVN